MHLSLGDSPDPTTLTYPRDLIDGAGKNEVNGREFSPRLDQRLN